MTGQRTFLIWVCPDDECGRYHTMSGAARAGTCAHSLVTPKLVPTEVVPKSVLDEAVREANDTAEMLNRVAGERDEAREALAWIAEYGTRDGDLKDDWAEAMRNIALNRLAAGSEEETDRG